MGQATRYIMDLTISSNSRVTADVQVCRFEDLNDIESLYICKSCYLKFRNIRRSYVVRAEFKSGFKTNA